MPEDNRIYVNGINGLSGEYLVEPLEVSEVASLARGEPEDKAHTSWIAKIWHAIRTPFMGLPLGTDPSDVSQAGWAVVFLSDEDPAVRKALEPLVEHRRKQIGNDALVKVLDYRPGESWDAWLGRYGVSPGTIDPTRVPYYLLLVGDPQRISFNFGNLLDVEYGVGRLHFDNPEEYALYAASVVDYETGSTVPNVKEAVFFGTRHPFDRATQLSADFLVNPLADGVPAAGGSAAVSGVADLWGYRTRKIVGKEATKAALMDVVCPPAPAAGSPAFLFTASHGVGFPSDIPEQSTRQGAILCQDWPGFGNISPAHFFSAADVPREAKLQGSVIFHFACYGAGTPERDQFVHKKGQRPPQIASKAFLSALPKTWLTHPGGAALAVIGHVERAWGYSIVSANAGPQIQTFQNAIGRILTGQPLGFALKDFNERYAALSTGLSSMLQQAVWGASLDDNVLAANWIERNDAEGYILIGDPAVRLRADLLTPAG